LTEAQLAGRPGWADGWALLGWAGYRSGMVGLATGAAWLGWRADPLCWVGGGPLVALVGPVVGSDCPGRSAAVPYPQPELIGLLLGKVQFPALFLRRSQILTEARLAGGQGLGYLGGPCLVGLAT
jgi:hypothetical protein